MIVAAADYASGKKVQPPPELLEYFTSQRLGALPNGQGWKNEPAGWADRVTTYTNAYDAVKSHKKAKASGGKSYKQWMRDNADTLRTLKQIEDMRNGINSSDSS